MSLRVSIGQLFELTDDGLTYCRQLGVAGIVLLIPRTSLDVPDLVELRTRCEGRGLRLEAIEQIPIYMYEKAMLGLVGRDQQIGRYQQILRNLGAAEIPILGLHWAPNHVWRTSHGTPGRGGAEVSSFDYGLVRDAPLTHGRVYTPDEMRSNFDYFMEAVLPVAEEAGVRIALHPDDPPVPTLGGIARVFADFDAFRWATERWDSPNFGLLFCIGTWLEMGDGALDALRYFCERDRVVYVHMRDVKGHVPKFQECFLGEGDLDVGQAVQILRDTGFTGFLIDDHSPRMLGDTDWNFRGRAYSTGYLTGLLAGHSG